MTSKKNWTWTDNYTISSYDTDPWQSASVPSIFQFMQETAYNHANHLEFGYVHLKDNNQFWVLSRLLLKMERFPTWTERINLTTWAVGTDRLFALRDFRITDQENKVIGNATTSWLILDMEKRRPQKPTPLATQQHLFPKERSLDTNAGKVPTIDTPTPNPRFTVTYSDLDLYNHVNNCKYIQWLMDCFPLSHHQHHQLSEILVNFNAETLWGEEICISQQPTALNETGTGGSDAIGFIHNIDRCNDNKTVCSIQTTWKKTENKYRPPDV